MRYDPNKIEKKWQKIWQKEGIYEPDLKRAKRPFYNLMMFPYPSAEGLHIGSVRTFTGIDIYGRFKRMQGYDVFEPIGLDGFGIHSENYALKVGKHPMQHAKDSEKNFYRQLSMIGNGFAWREKLETYDPEYYRWTQWIFAQMFKRGLAYRKKSPVNWCPSCMTVLADEQVLQGECERCQSKVIKKDLEQWFFKITEYAERLLKNLEKIDWPEPIKIAQRNWIGRSEGALITFKVIRSAQNDADRTQTVAEKIQRDSASSLRDSATLTKVNVFTTRPDTLFGATYMVLAPEHPLIKNLELRIKNLGEVGEYVKKAKAKSEEDRIAGGRDKIGVELKGVKAINPANGEEIPIWVADYVLGNVGTGAIMAVPAHDERDFEFAKKYNLPIKIVVCPHYPAKTCPVLDRAYVGPGHLVDSGQFNGMPFEKAKWEITKFVGGEKITKYRLRDWLISRQRYWGAPIPMIYCPACAKASAGKENAGWQAVPEKDLPVRLPYIKNFRPTGTDKSPLATVEKFYKVRCPKCKSWARRETDVSDTFLDSAWYYLGYLILGNQKSKIKNQKFIFPRDIVKRWLPVDMYIGGAEHAVLHLLYVRFLAMVFYNLGLTHFEEPFKKFRTHGLITKDGAKMSKSRGNVVNPDDYIKAYGSDAIRMYLAFLAPLTQGGDFRDDGIKGLTRFLERVWRFSLNVIARSVATKQSHEVAARPAAARNDGLNRALHRTIKKVTEDIESLQYNTAISALMILLNEFEHANSAPPPSGSGNANAPMRIEDLKIFLKLLAPFAPFISEELWSRFFADKKSRIPDSYRESGRQRLSSIHLEPWPEYDPKFIKEETFELVIQVNGKVRGRATLPVGVAEEEAKKVALAEPSVRQYISAEIRKVIFVPNKLINFVM